MKLFYVMGGGWGHLYRVRTFIRQLDLTDIKILTNNPLAEKLFSKEEIIHVTGETQEDVVNCVRSLIRSLAFDELYIDTFPAGLFGELDMVVNRKTTYLARRLKWNAYRNVMKESIYMDEMFYFEELEPDHQEFIKSVSGNQSSIKLQYPVPQPDRVRTNLLPTKRPVWLIVHSFHKEEVESLLHYAQDIARIENQHPTFVVLSDQRVDDPEIMVYSWFPACDWFPLADRIFTGGGFNTMQQVEPFITKVTSIPFPRKYDDQAWRIHQAKMLV